MCIDLLSNKKKDEYDLNKEKNKSRNFGEEKGKEK